MNLSLWDIAILIPAAPGIIVLVTWWLPWEKWIWDAETGGEFPKYFLAGYLAYLSFVVRHFKFSKHYRVALLLLRSTSS